MKNYALQILPLFVGSLLFGQVGISTSNPQGMFHIDGGKDNPSTGIPSTIQQSNDILVTPLGNVGMGTIAPTNKLHINSATAGGIRITDGTQGEGKVLTSDADGVGTWSFAPIKYDSKSSQTAISVNTANTWINSGLSVVVPETGYYYINFNARAYMYATVAGQQIPDGAYWKSELRSANGMALGTVFGAHASTYVATAPAAGGTTGNNADVTGSFSSVKLLNKGDILSLWFWGSYTFTCIGDANGASSITIFRLGS